MAYRMASLAGSNDGLSPLDKGTFFAILSVAKTTRYDPPGMAGF